MLKINISDLAQLGQYLKAHKPPTQVSALFVKLMIDSGYTLDEIDEISFKIRLHRLR